MKRKNLLLLCVIALVAICLASCGLVENLPGSDKLPGCIELYGSHNVKHVDAKDATCTEAGNIEYWYCESCGTVWSDSANTKQITKESTVVAKIDHEYTYACDAICAACGELTNESATHTIAHVEAKAPKCDAEGNIEYWYCTDCGYAWADEKLTKVTNLKSVIIPELECNTVHFEAIAPACHYNGQIEHWVCYDCERVWQDEALTQLTNIKNVVLPATGNGLLVYMEATEAGCHSNGCIEHWICYTCEQVWQDEALTQLTNIKNVTIPAKGSNLLVHMDAVAPGCHYTGNVEYWTCYECNGVWTDEALTQVSNVKNVVIPELGGDVVHVDAKAPTCTELGNIEHWYCETCGQVWADEARTQLTNHMSVKLGTVDHEYFYACDGWCMNCYEFTNPEATHTLTHVEAVEATCQATGNIEYWTCSDCGGCWDNENATGMPLNKMMVITFVDHEYFYACDAHCMNCGELTNPEATHNIEYHAAVVPTCQNDGFQEYWQCTECYCTWADEDLMIQTVPFRLWIPAEPCTPEYACESKCKWCFGTVETDGHVAVLVNAVASTCAKNGNIAHYTCEHCGKLWYDKELTQTLSKNEVTLPLLPHEYRFECDAWCMNCYEQTNEYASHYIEFVEAKDPTCISFGNIEHYACVYCAGCWDNIEGTGMPLNKMMVSIAKVDHEALSPCYPECKWCFQPVFEDNAHSVEHVAAKDKTCLLAGNKEHWICTQCNTVWLDEALTKTTNYASVMIPTIGEHTYIYDCDSVCSVCLLESRPENTHEYTYKCDKVCKHCYLETNPTADHTVAHVEAVAATCHQTGNVEYWYCTDCLTAWTDETLRYQTNLKSVITPALVGLTYVAEVPATCHQLGCQEYWYCTDCNAVFADAEGRYLTNRLNLTLVYTAEIIYVEALAPTCTESGNYEFWYCAECETIFTDATLIHVSAYLSLVIPATGHNYEAVVTAPTCTEDGYTTHTCANCDDEYVDTEVDALGHDYEGVVTAPTCTKTGYTTYTCADCDDEYVDDEVAALGHDYVDGYCETCGGVDPDYYFSVTIPEAVEAEDGWKVEVSGTVSVINTAWSDSYGNISVTIVDADGNELYLFRLATNVALGDIITVKGVMATYKGNRQVAAGATAVITGHDDSYDVVTEVTIEEALASSDGTNVIVTGTVAQIDEAWSTQYKNMCVTIVDANGNKLYVYRLATQVGAGDYITITGSMGTYNGSRQIAAGATAEIITVHGDNHTYANGVCTACGASEPVSNATTVVVSISDYATANSWTNDTKYSTISMDASITVTATGGSNTGKYYNSGTNWRIYQTESPSVVITAAEGKTIVSVKITYTSNKTGVLTYGGNNISSNTVVTVNGSSITFGVGNTDSSVTNGQVRITSIEVVYS